MDDVHGRIGRITAKAIELGVALRELPSGLDALCALEFCRAVLLQRLRESGLSERSIVQAQADGVQLSGAEG